LYNYISNIIYIPSRFVWFHQYLGSLFNGKPTQLVQFFQCIDQAKAWLSILPGLPSNWYMERVAPLRSVWFSNIHRSSQCINIWTWAALAQRTNKLGYLVEHDLTYKKSRRVFKEFLFSLCTIQWLFPNTQQFYITFLKGVLDQATSYGYLRNCSCLDNIDYYFLLSCRTSLFLML
jgi:hypothetical protein